MQFYVGEAEILRDRLTELLDDLEVNAKKYEKYRERRAAKEDVIDSDKGDK